MSEPGQNLVNYQCQPGHELVINQRQTNKRDQLTMSEPGQNLVNYQCQPGHKLVINQCQTNRRDQLSMSTQTLASNYLQCLKTDFVIFKLFGFFQHPL